MTTTTRPTDPTILDALSVLPFWEELASGQQRMLADAAEIRGYGPREPILRVKSSQHGLILVLEGCIRSYISSEGGKEVTLFLVQHGEPCLLSTSCASCQVQTLADSRLLLIERHVWEGLTQDCPGVLRFSLSAMRRHMEAMLRAVEVQFFSPVEKRVASLLVEHMELEGSTGTLRLTHNEIALHLGTAREVVSRTLEEFSRTGLLKTGRGRLTILDSAALRAIASK
jgi:CRP/FNR family transcriptional regulator